MKKTKLILVLLLFVFGNILFAQALGQQSMAYHTIALAQDGTVYTCGGNSYGQLGDSTTTERLTPIKVVKGAYSGTTYLGDDSNNKIIAVALGHSHSIALAEDGLVYTWGYNLYGQLGDSTSTDRHTPVKVVKGFYNGTRYLGDDSNNKIIAIALGDYCSIVLAEDGTVYTWGRNDAGQLGNNTDTGSRTPIKVLKGAYSGTTYLGDDSNNKIIAVALGNSHSIALAQDGTVYTWGFNDYGQLGDNSTTNNYIPVIVDVGLYSGTNWLGDDPTNKIIDVSLGFYHSIALAEDGTVYTWGRNNNGQLGDDSNLECHTPMIVYKGAYSGTDYLGDESNNKIIAVTLGAAHSIALAQDGTVYTWGSNNYGQLGDNTDANRYTPIKVLGVGGVGDLVLPITLSSFTANSQNGNIALSWRTGSETENLGYLLERRVSTVETWTEIASYLNNDALMGHGTTTENNMYQYLDDTVYPGVIYIFRLGDVDYNNTITWHDEIEITILAEESEIPVEFGLQKAYPNPFNPSVTLSYSLTEDAMSTLMIYDMRGQLVETLQSGHVSAGNHSVIWQAINESTGLYIVRLQSANEISMQKIVYVK